MTACFEAYLKAPSALSYLEYLYGCEPEIRGDEESGWAFCASAADKAIFTAADAIADPDEALAALRPHFSHWIRDYAALLTGVIDAGYEFRSLDRFEPADNDRRVGFIRYDIHPWDMGPTYGMLDVNRALGIPGVFYLNWDFGEEEARLRDRYRAYRKFEDGETVRFGLHASPVSSWFIFDRFDGRQKRFVYWLLRSFRPYADALLGAGDMPESGPADALPNLLDGAQRRFRIIAESFRAAFPEAVSVAAHGDTLASQLFKLRAEDKRYGVLHEALYSVNFLNAEDQRRVREAGFAFEANAPRGATDRIVHIGDGSDGALLAKRIRGAIEERRPFILTLHPSKAHYLTYRLPDLHAA